MDKTSDLNNSNVSRIEWLLFALTILWSGWFITPLPNWNILSRVDLSSSIVLDHKVDIDRYKGNTGDIACTGEHFYSDKAPGTSWLSLPALTAYSFKLVIEPRNPWQVWLMTFFAVSIPSSLLVVLIFRFIAGATGSVTASLASTLCYAFGTIALPYSTLFISHQPVALMLFALMMLAHGRARDYKPGLSSIIQPLFFGFLLGALFVTEYQAAAAGSLIAVYYLFNIPERKLSILALSSAAIAVSALLPVACWLAYNASVFHQLIGFGYHHECLAEFQAGMSKGIHGFTFPSVKIAYDLFLLPGRGLFFVSPFLLFSIPGLLIMSAKKGIRAVAFVTTLICLIIIVVNLTIYQPLGGASMGPRYLLPMLPFLAVAAGFFLASKGPVFYEIAGGFTFVSATQMFLGTITNPQSPRGIMEPVFSYILPMLKDGYIRPGVFSFVFRQNWAQVAPLVVLTGFLLIILFFAVRRAMAKTTDARTMLKAFVVFVLSFIIFGFATVAADMREAAKLPATSKNLALADTYYFVSENKLAEKRYVQYFSLMAGIKSKNASLAPLCFDINAKPQYQLAVNCFEKCLAVAKPDSAVLTALTDAYEKMGRIEEKDRTLLFGARLFPSNSSFMIKFARDMLKQGKYNEAAAAAGDILKMNPRHVEALRIAEEARAGKNK